MVVRANHCRPPWAHPCTIIRTHTHTYTIICNWACKNQPTECKKSPILSFLLYHNFITIYTTTTKSSSLLQNLMGFLLQLTELGYYVLNEKSENITWCNLHSHSRFLQARSHMLTHTKPLTLIPIHTSQNQRLLCH